MLNVRASAINFKNIKIKTFVSHMLLNNDKVLWVIKTNVHDCFTLLELRQTFIYVKILPDVSTDFHLIEFTTDNLGLI